MASAWLPRRARSAVYRNMVRCDQLPSPRLTFKLAETEEELEACFRLLHDAYVAAGFMQPDVSGLRVTVYHALPTTTTLLAKFDDRVVGTVSLIRESVLGFPLQKIFDISAIRRVGGNIAEVSALAVDRRFQSTGGAILFPLMKFMHEYAVRYFDTRHLVIAVNPRHIGLYESLLFFKRLRPNPVEHYDFVNGAPAVGAHLDLAHAPEIYRKHYAHRLPEKNLYHYFTGLQIPNIEYPDKRFFTTTDPVMTPALINHFFNMRTRVFSRISDREKMLLHAIYDLPAYRAYLPLQPLGERTELKKRQHRRFSVMCPAEFSVDTEGEQQRFSMKVIECSMTGFRVRTDAQLQAGMKGVIEVDLGEVDHCRLDVEVLRRGRSDEHTFVFKIHGEDKTWQKFVNVLRKARTHGDLAEATRFLRA
ncbi:MAG: PilZ domain-containing protein [Moraxellaceae bacterium]|nr:PilZ domain-containing protein [Moraxellaceae bacterium]